MAGTSFRRRDKKFSKKMQRSLDPAMLLSRGLSSRFVGANVMQSITPLNKDEIEKDLRHMNAYYQANVAYAQQHYIFMNREELGAQAAQQQLTGPTGSGSVSANGNGTGGAGFYGAPGGATVNHTENIMVPPIAMPVRIDPEEEKRLQNLRKKIALCETQREFLESQYVSLRAHYVATTKELAAASKNSDGLIIFLQTITKRRGKLLAWQRARLQIARDVLACLQARLSGLQIANSNSASMSTNGNVGVNKNVDGNGDAHENEDVTKMDVDSPNKNFLDSRRAESGPQCDADAVDTVQVWIETEEMLKEAEVACHMIPSTLALNEKKVRKKSKKGAPASDPEDHANQGVLPWDAIKMPNTPQDVPLYLSQLALVPEKGAAFNAGGVLGSNKSSLCWIESSMPQAYNAKKEQLKVSELRDEVKLLQEELAKERSANRDIQLGIVGRRKRSDELVAMMTLLRGETEAILQRHNILLDSPEAKDAARELHEEVVRTRAKAVESGPSDGNTATALVNSGDGTGDKQGSGAHHSSVAGGKKSSPGGKEKVPKDDNENDGDDEGEVGEEEDEEGEIVETKPGKREWGERGSNHRKRDLAAGLDDESPGRKRRKL